MSVTPQFVLPSAPHATWPSCFLRWMEGGSSQTLRPFSGCCLGSLPATPFPGLLWPHRGLCPRLCRPSQACEWPQQHGDVTGLQPPSRCGWSIGQLLATLDPLLQSSAQREGTTPGAGPSPQHLLLTHSCSQGRLPQRCFLGCKSGLVVGVWWAVF